MDKPRQVDLQVQQISVKMQKSYLKVLYLLPAFNDTFVMLNMYSVGKDVLVHCNKEGKVMFQYKFAKGVDSLGMVQKNKAIVLETELNQITVVDLSNYQMTHIPFQFFYAEPQALLMTFPQTKYLCVVEIGRYNDNRIRLTYFAGHLTPQSKPIAVYQSDSAWSCEYSVRSGDEHSMVIWAKARHDEQFQIKEFHLQGVNPKFNHFTALNNIGLPYGKEKLQVGLINVWSISPQRFLLICQTEKALLGLQSNEKNNNNNFIWDTSNNEIRQTKFYFGDIYNDVLIDCFFVGRYSVFHSYSFINGKAQPSPIFYVDSNEEKLLPLQRKWHCTYLTKFAFPGYESGTYVENEYENSNVDKFSVKIIKLSQKK